MGYLDLGLDFVDFFGQVFFGIYLSVNLHDLGEDPVSAVVGSFEENFSQNVALRHGFSVSVFLRTLHSSLQLRTKRIVYNLGLLVVISLLAIALMMVYGSRKLLRITAAVALSKIEFLSRATGVENSVLSL